MQLNLPSWIHPFRFKDTGHGGIPLWGWVLLGVCGSLLSWHWITNEDLGFQLNAARYLVENGDVPRQEPFLWTEPTGTYINLQWLWQLPCYGIWKTGGAGWLMAFNLVLQLLAVGVLILRRMRLGQGSLELGVGTFLILLLFFFLNDWRVRPHSLSWIYLGLVMLVLEANERGDRGALWFLPCIFLFWVNCHALFSLGLASLLLWASVDLVCTLLRHGPERLRNRTKSLGLPLGLSLGACLINPYGLAGLAFPFRQSQILSGNHYASGVIMEFEPLWKAVLGREILDPGDLFDGGMTMFFLLLLGTGLYFGRRSISVPSWIVTAVFVLLSLKMVKNVNYLFMVAGPFAALGLDRYVASLRVVYPQIVSRALLMVCAALCILIPSGIWSNWLWQMPFGVGLDPEVHPTKIAEVLGRFRGEPRVLNGHNNGGWIGFISGKKVFLDARNDHYSETLLRSYIESKRDLNRFVDLLDRWNVEVVVARFSGEPAWVLALQKINRGSWGQFRDEKGKVVPLWRCVTRDECTALFLRQDIAPEIPAMQDVGVASDPFLESDRALDQTLLVEANKPDPGWRRLVLGVDAFPTEVNLLVGRDYLFGELDSAKVYALQGLKSCRWFYSSLWSNLELVFRAEGDHARAEFCRKVLLKKNEP